MSGNALAVCSNSRRAKRALDGDGALGRSEQMRCSHPMVLELCRCAAAHGGGARRAESMVCVAVNRVVRDPRAEIMRGVRAELMKSTRV